MTPDAPPLYHTAMWSVPGETPLFLRPDNAENTDCTPRAFATTDPPDPESVEDILPTRRLFRRCPTGGVYKRKPLRIKEFSARWNIHFDIVFLFSPRRTVISPANAAEHADQM